MRFWISLMVGIVVLTVAGTVMVVMNPGMQAPKSAEDELVVPTGPQPRAVVDKTKETQDNVAQGVQKSSTFSVRNEGEGELQLRPFYPRCTCSGLLVSQKTPEGEEDFIRLKAVDKKWGTTASKNNPRYVGIPPGGTAEIIVEWDTTNRLGKYAVEGELQTNDAANPRLSFQVELNVKKDVMYHEQQVLEFGTIQQGETTERELVVFSPISEEMTILKTETDTPSLQVALRPIPEATAKELQAKSGNLVVVTSDGTLPEGYFQHKLLITNSLHPETSDAVPITGAVKGKMELLPSVANFKIVQPGKTREVQLKIFAHGLEEGRSLKVGELTPSFLEAELTQGADFATVWNLVVQLKGTAPTGPFNGNLSIVDDQGQKRLNIPTRGVVSGTTGSK